MATSGYMHIDLLEVISSVFQLKQKIKNNAK